MKLKKNQLKKHKKPKKIRIKLANPQNLRSRSRDHDNPIKSKQKKSNQILNQLNTEG